MANASSAAKKLEQSDRMETVAEALDDGGTCPAVEANVASILKYVAADVVLTDVQIARLLRVEAQTVVNALVQLARRNIVQPVEETPLGWTWRPRAGGCAESTIAAAMLAGFDVLEPLPAAG